MLTPDLDTPFLERYARGTSPRADAPSFDPSRLRLDRSSPEDLEAARYAWAARWVDEYRSVALFSHLLTLLNTLEAPHVAQQAVHRLIGEELRHSQFCALVLRRLDPEERFQVDLSGMAPTPTGEDPAVEAFLLVVYELWVAESESLGAIRAYRDACGDPALKEQMVVLLREEVGHAALGRHLTLLLARSLPREPLRVVFAKLPELVDARAREIRGTLQAAAQGGPGRYFGASLEPSELPRAPDHGPLLGKLAAVLAS